MSIQYTDKIDYSERLKNVSPVVHHVRVMRSKNLAGNWTDYDYVMTIIASGRACFFFDGIRNELSAGDVILMPPYHKHVILPIGEEELIQYIFHFDFYPDPNRENLWGKTYEQVVNQAPCSRQEMEVCRRPFIWHLEGNDFMEAQSDFLKMHLHFTKKDELYRLHLKYLALKLIVHCCSSLCRTQNEPAGANSKAQINVQRAIEIIRRSYDDPHLSNESIAAQLNITPKYLSHIFKTTLGIPMHQYITQTRMHIAESMIALQCYNFTEIAFAVGFSGIHSFSKVFKKKTGYSPSEYLQHLLTDEEQAYIKY